MLLQPAFGLPQLLGRVGAAHFAVRCDERRMPGALQCAAKLLLRVVAAPEPVQRRRAQARSAAAVAADPRTAHAQRSASFSFVRSSRESSLSRPAAAAASSVSGGSRARESRGNKLGQCCARSLRARWTARAGPTPRDDRAEPSRARAACRAPARARRRPAAARLSSAAPPSRRPDESSYASLSHSSRRSRDPCSCAARAASR